MSGVIGRRTSLGQADGTEVELVVSGTRDYATYETPDGYTVIYDQEAGFFYYATLQGGELQSTGVLASAPPPAGVERHARESEEVRARKISESQERHEGRD